MPARLYSSPRSSVPCLSDSFGPYQGTRHSSGRHSAKGFAMNRSVVPVCICAHDDYWFLTDTIGSFSTAGPVTVVISRIAWDGSEGAWQRCALASARSGAEVILGYWNSEASQRQFAMHLMQER